MKAHSERVPDKNMRDFAGRPLYHAVMEALVKSRYVERVVINTDSEAIKEDALDNFKDHVLIHDRPEAIRGDFVETNKIIGHDVGLLMGEHFLQTHCTNPLLTTATIERAIERYFEALGEGFDSLFTVTRLQTRLYDAEGKAINHDPAVLLRTQDLPPVYEENSCMYLFSHASFAAHERRIGAKPIIFEIPREEACDIDEEVDFKVAEFLYRSLR